jgi:GNAT superfamily N-acetyltransferase
VVLRDLRGEADAGLLRRLHREVLAPSFPPEELESPEALVDGLRSGRVRASVALAEAGEPLGGLLQERYGDVVLLAYLAVAPGARDAGIGTGLLDRARAAWSATPDVRLVVAEVHDSAARLRFFARAGARTLDVPFVQPGIGPGAPRVPGFRLLALHVDDGLTDGGGIPSDLLAGFVRRYYEAAEGVTPPYDAELSELLERIQRRPRVLIVSEPRRSPS